MANNYFFTSDGKLRSVSDDELYHWKYVKREKVNGKWKYYYKDDNGKSKNAVNSISDITGMKESAAKMLLDVGAKSGIESGKFKDAVSMLSEGDADMQKTLTDIVKKSTKNKIEKAKTKCDEYLKSVGNKTDSAIKESKKVIDAAKHYVNRLFSKKSKKKK